MNFLFYRETEAIIEEKKTSTITDRGQEIGCSDHQTSVFVMS